MKRAGIALAFAGILVAAHPVWFRWLAEFLIAGEPPRKADIAVVLAGDHDGYRILHAAELVRQGFVPKALVSGPSCCYHHVEADLAVDYAVSKGYPREYFDKLPTPAYSTRTESAGVMAELRRRGVKHFLLVTSNFHTRRAGRFYRPQLGGIEMTVVAANTPDFPPNGWWLNHNGQRFFLLEWTKTIVGPFGL